METATSRTEFRYSQSTSKMTFWMLLGTGIFMLLLAAIPLLNGKSILNVVTGLFVALGIAIIVFALWYKKRRENERDAKLVIDAHMIHPVTATAKSIAWADVEKIVFIKSRPNKPGYMAIDVKGDIGRFEPTRAAKMMAKANSMLGFGEISVRSLDFDGTPEQIKAAILAANPHVEIWDK